MKTPPNKPPSAALSDNNSADPETVEDDNDDLRPPLLVEAVMAHDEVNTVEKEEMSNNVVDENEKTGEGGDLTRPEIIDYVDNDDTGPLPPIAQLEAAATMDYGEDRKLVKEETLNNVVEEGLGENSYANNTAAGALSSGIGINLPQPPIGSSSLNDDADDDARRTASVDQLLRNDGTSQERNNEEISVAPLSSVRNTASSHRAGVEEGERESLPILDATLVDENEARVHITYLQQPVEPVYRAEPIENPSNGHPWWKRNQGYLIAGFLLLVGAIVIVTIVVVFDSSREDGATGMNGPSVNDLSSSSPSLHPTKPAQLRGNESSLQDETTSLSLFPLSPFPSESPSASVPPLVWGQLGRDILGLASRDQFGNSVSLSADGMTMVVGAPAADRAIPSIYDPDGSDDYSSGQVRVFRWNNSSVAPLGWTQIGNTIDGEGSEWLGWFVDISADGKIVAAGATFFSRGNGYASGRVKVYEYEDDASSWNQLGSDIKGEYESDSSGHSVSLSSDGLTVAIGAPVNRGNGFCSGQVRVYTWIGSDWSQVGQDVDGGNAGEGLGYSVALSADGLTLAAGSPYSGVAHSGMVQVYRWSDDSSGWTTLGQPIVGEEEGDSSGYSVALSSDGMIVAVGAIKNDGNGTNFSGHTRLYKLDGVNTTWRQIGQDIDGEEARDQSGWSIDLAENGKTVAIGAPFNDGIGVDSGHVRIYQWDEPSSDWIKVGQDIDGESTRAKAGQSVSISADGSIVAIGSIGDNIGTVRVFHIP